MPLVEGWLDIVGKPDRHGTVQYTFGSLRTTNPSHSSRKPAANVVARVRVAVKMPTKSVLRVPVAEAVFEMKDDDVLPVEILIDGVPVGNETGGGS